MARENQEVRNLGLVLRAEFTCDREIDRCGLLCRGCSSHEKDCAETDLKFFWLVMCLEILRIGFLQPLYSSLKKEF